MENVNFGLSSQFVAEGVENPVALRGSLVLATWSRSTDGAMNWLNPLYYRLGRLNQAEVNWLESEGTKIEGQFKTGVQFYVNYLEMPRVTDVCLYLNDAAAPDPPPVSVRRRQKHIDNIIGLHS